MSGLKLCNVLVNLKGYNDVLDGNTLTEDQLFDGNYCQFDELLQSVIELGVSKEELIKFINNPRAKATFIELPSEE